MCGRLRKLLVIAAIAAVVAAVVRALRGEPAPQFATHPSVLGGPAPAPAPDAEGGGEASVADDPAEAAAELTTGDAPVAQLEPGERAAGALAAPQPLAGELAEGDAGGALELVDAAWVDPVEGACPEGYPIKAKLKSGIYHQPGGLAYERTKPDRCYATAEAAEADGLRAAKR
jgi:hypothetical protein